MGSSAFAARLKRELEMLEREPPPGISVWPKEERVDVLMACIRGTKGTPYDGGFFYLEVSIPSRYPFEPPRVKFLTPVYHPNIDSSGRICLNILNMPPKGGWKPALNISTVLASIQLLMAEPNPDDALMVEISEQFVKKRETFEKEARQKTLDYAKQNFLKDQANAQADEKEGVLPPGSSEQEVNSTPTEAPAGDDVQKINLREDAEEEEQQNYRLNRKRRRW